MIAFGSVAGFAFNWLTSIEILPTIAPIGNHVLCGIFGAAAGGLGAYLSGGTIGLTIGSGDALSYRNWLDAGKYLIIIKGSDKLTQPATQTLRQFELENIQGYTEPVGARSHSI